MGTRVEALARLSDVERAADGDGPVVWAAQGPGEDRLGPGVRVWRHGAAVAVASPNAQQDRLVVRDGGGEGADALALVRLVLREVGPSYRLLGDAAVVRTLVRELPGLVPIHRFLWMETTSPPGDRTGHRHAAGGVRWLDGREAGRATSLFDRFFPASYAQPGREGVRRWAGVLGEVNGSAAAEPLVVAADAWSAAGCGFMGGVVAHPAARGRGLARAVSAFVLDALVSRYGRAALMVLTGNAPAVATYERLGMTGRLFEAAGVAGPVPAPPAGG